MFLAWPGGSSTIERSVYLVRLLLLLLLLLLGPSNRGRSIQLNILVVSHFSYIPGHWA
jgi:hypothetical protein